MCCWKFIKGMYYDYEISWQRSKLHYTTEYFLSQKDNDKAVIQILMGHLIFIEYRHKISYDSNSAENE